jgi:hypothetical protein
MKKTKFKMHDNKRKFLCEQCDRKRARVSSELTRTDLIKTKNSKKNKKFPRKTKRLMSTKFSLKIVRTYGVVVTVVSSLLLVLQNLKNPKSNKERS